MSLLQSLTAREAIRSEYLLKHTSGWDNMHLREFAQYAPPSTGLREALEMPGLR